MSISNDDADQIIERLRRASRKDALGEEAVDLDDAINAVEAQRENEA